MRSASCASLARVGLIDRPRHPPRRALVPPGPARGCEPSFRALARAGGVVCLPVFVDDGAVHVVMAECHGAGTLRPADGDGQESPLLAVESVVFGSEAGAAAGVLVARRSAAELVKARLGVDRMVLPV